MGNPFNGVDDGSDQDSYGSGFNPNASSQPSQSEQNAPFSSSDVTEDTLALPSSFSGGLDRLRAQRERKIASLRQQSQISPVYQDANGGITRQAPVDNRGWYKPLGGDAYQIGSDDQFVPVQEKMARQLEQTMPVAMTTGELSNQNVWANRNTIFQKLMIGNEGKPLTADTFMDNPYWDDIKAQKGLDDQTMGELKNTVLHAIQPLDKQFKQNYKLNQFTAQVVSDPDAKQFLDDFQKELGPQPSFAKKYAALQSAQAKADAIHEDPTLKDAWNEISQSQDPNDIELKNTLLRVHSSSAFERGVTRYLSQKEKLQGQRDKSSDSVDIWAQKNLPGGAITDATKATLQDDIAKRKLDPSHYNSLLPKFLSLLEHTDSDAQVNAPWGTPYNGLKDQVQEKTMVDHFQKLVELGADPTKIAQLPGGRVIKGDKDMADATIAHFHTMFGDTKLVSAKPGDYVEIPAGRFTDESGNPGYLHDPDSPDLPVTYQYNGSQYVLRKWLDAKGITKDQLDPKNTHDPIIFATKYLQDNAETYEAPMLRGDKILSDVDDAGNSTVGKKLKMDQQFYQDTQDLRDREKFAEQTWFTQPKANNPGWFSSSMKFIGDIVLHPINSIEKVGQGFLPATTKGMVSAGVGIMAAANSLKNTALASYYGVKADYLGDDDAANKAAQYWEDAKGNNANVLAYPGIHKAIDEATAGGWMDLNKWNLSPNASTADKALVAIGSFGGSFLSFAATAEALGPEKLLGSASEIGEGGVLLSEGKGLLGAISKASTNQAQLAALLKTAGNSAEITTSLTKQLIAATLTKSAIEMVGYGLLHGESSAREIGSNAATGLLFGGASTLGKGFGSKPLMQLAEEAGEGGNPTYRAIAQESAKGGFFPSPLRMSAAALATAGVGGLDVWNKYMDGMSSQEIKESLSKPEDWANMSITLIQALLGNHMDWQLPKEAPGEMAKAGNGTVETESATPSKSTGPGVDLGVSEAMPAKEPIVPFTAQELSEGGPTPERWMEAHERFASLHNTENRTEAQEAEFKALQVELGAGNEAYDHATGVLDGTRDAMAHRGAALVDRMEASEGGVATTGDAAALSLRQEAILNPDKISNLMPQKVQDMEKAYAPVLLSEAEKLNKDPEGYEAAYHEDPKLPPIESIRAAAKVIAYEPKVTAKPVADVAPDFDPNRPLGQAEIKQKAMDAFQTADESGKSLPETRKKLSKELGEGKTAEEKLALEGELAEHETQAREGLGLKDVQEGEKAATEHNNKPDCVLKNGNIKV